MEWLNYHHLLYFWTVAREGTIAAAGKELRLTQPTISGQIRELERSLGEPLFMKSGRRLVLTEMGKVVFEYADEIFTLGRELHQVVRGRAPRRGARFVVGIADVLPKPIAYLLLQPAMLPSSGVAIVCHEDKPDRLLLRLSNHELDLVLADAPASSTVRVRAYSDLLGSSGLSFFAAASLASKYRQRFPKSLEGAPMLLPMLNSNIRRSLDAWFDTQHLRPAIIGEFEDSALLEVFGQQGAGIFTAPTAIEKDVKRIYRASVIGRADTVVQEFYAISVERRLKHPAVVAISEAARVFLG